MDDAMLHLDDSDQNTAPEKFGKRVYNKAVELLEQARPLSDNLTLLLSTYGHKVILDYFKCEGIGLERLKSLGGVRVEIVENHIVQNHPAASIGIRVT